MDKGSGELTKAAILIEDLPPLNSVGLTSDESCMELDGGAVSPFILT